MKLCKDCKWCRLDAYSDSYAVCGNPKALPGDWRHVVTGEPLPRYCTAARNSLYGGCGQEGKLFEPKETAL